MKKGIAGMVILYYPDSHELFPNINSYLPFLDILIVIDNTGKTGLKSIRERLSLLPNVKYFANNENRGVAAALNQGAAMALEDGYEWLLTMDQDSFFEEKQAKLYFTLFETGLLQTKDLALIAPAHYSALPQPEKEPYSDKTSVMTSGNLLNLKAWEKLNGFDEKLFIDEVDHEYCYRLRINGFRILQMNHVLLDHQLGTQKEAGYFGAFARKKRRIHSPGRVYFMVRNYLYVRKKYQQYFPEEFKERNKALRVTLKNNLFFSGKFIKNLKNIRKAYLDYKSGEFRNSI